MDKQEIAALVGRLVEGDRYQREAVWNQLRPLDVRVATYLLRAYPVTRKWQARAALVYYSVPFARASEDAFKLGLLACGDKASLVRYRACSLLAYSLRTDALPALEGLLRHPDPKTIENAAAAIVAIKHQNHHFFIDRELIGKIFWQVKEPLE